uniref:Si:ch73-290k24.6 n=2 Tax=Paramormyrops kingsleyae TaxID=1676925 RepID=A0A3B3TC10_9TELE|nr:WW domain-binding protein 1-like isoform X1 [Paramormyrops kingsleyae]XP_023697583.1 WW domain-binding protein 1-like isoform X1 [Paramormyrops kingsleyae]
MSPLQHLCVTHTLEMGVSPTDSDMTARDQGVKHPSPGSLPVIASPKYCPGDPSGGGYLCESGHCCGETGCCTYYYELWWFWLLWTVLILFSCCCAYRHRRAKLRVQQQQRQREINLMAYHGARSHPASMLDLSFLASFKLPSYEEVAAQPRTPPPPYSTVFALHGGRHGERAGPSGLASSQSSDNYTSCSCESCSSVSASSSSMSMQATYETNTSNASTPGETDESRAPSADTARPATASPPPLPPPTLTPPQVAEQSERDSPIEQAPCEQASPERSLSPPKRTLFSSTVDFFEPDTSHTSDAEEEDSHAEGGHFRHRLLTGDSGIEVCRCKVESDDEDEEAGAGGNTEAGEGIASIHDSADCTGRAEVTCGTKAEEGGAVCGSVSLGCVDDAVIAVESM